jgi:hypothetical protein
MLPCDGTDAIDTHGGIRHERGNLLARSGALQRFRARSSTGEIASYAPEISGEAQRVAIVSYDA